MVYIIRCSFEFLVGLKSSHFLSFACCSHFPSTRLDFFDSCVSVLLYMYFRAPKWKKDELYSIQQQISMRYENSLDGMFSICGFSTVSLPLSLSSIHREQSQNCSLSLAYHRSPQILDSMYVCTYL